MTSNSFWAVSSKLKTYEASYWVIRPREGVCPRNRRSSRIPAQFLHQWVDSRNLKCKWKLRYGRVWCAHRFRQISNQQSFTLVPLVAEWVFSSFQGPTFFFRNLPPEADSDRILDFALLIRDSSRYFLANELLRSPSGDLMQKLCNMKSRPPPRCSYPVTSFILTMNYHDIARFQVLF